MKITKYQEGLMKHTIKETGRNFFGTSFNTKDSLEFEKLVEAGYATKREAADWMGDDVIYYLTEKGKNHVSSIKPIIAKPISRSKKRYQAYLHSETSESFIEFLCNPYWKSYIHEAIK